MGKVEGITLDLTRIPESGEYALEDLIVHETSKPSKYKISKEEYRVLHNKYAQPCTFCDKKSHKMNFDHINMFEKTGTVGFMIRYQYKFTEIMREIEKCHLLCISCHKIITKYEYDCGFTSKKQILNKAIRAKEDITDMKSILIEEYRAKMGPFYEKMRASRGKLEENRDPGVMLELFPI